MRMQAVLGAKMSACQSTSSFKMKTWMTKYFRNSRLKEGQNEHSKIKQTFEKIETVKVFNN